MPSTKQFLAAVCTLLACLAFSAASARAQGRRGPFDLKDLIDRVTDRDDQEDEDEQDETPASDGEAGDSAGQTIQRPGRLTAPGPRPGIKTAPAEGIASEDQSPRIEQVDIGGTVEYTPPLVRGDANFRAHGPEVTVHVRYWIEDGRVVRSVFMRAKETKSNWTTTEGWSPKEIVYTPPEGSTAERIVGAKLFRNVVDYRFTQGETKVFDTEVGRITVRAGYRTDTAGSVGLSARFDHTLAVRLKPGGPWPRRKVEVELPRTVEYTPPHKQGDHAFDGNGVRVNAGVWFVTKTQGNRDRLWLKLTMNAAELGGDGTLAAGTGSVPIYDTRPGERIVMVLDDPDWRNLVGYVDHDYKPDKNPPSGNSTELGDFLVYGDGKGIDAGVSTRVVAQLDHSVEVQVEPRR